MRPIRAFPLLLLCAALACADPTWEMGAVLDAASLHASPGEPPAYAPSGQPIDAIPSVQHMVPKGTERLIVGPDSIFLVDPGPPKAPEPKRHALFHRPKLPPRLVSRDEVMYSVAGNTLEIIDADGNLRDLPILRREPTQNNAGPLKANQ